MQSSSLSLWRIRAVAILLALVGASAFFFLMATSALAAAPTMTAVTADTDANGTVDRITITFSEASDLDDGAAGDGFTSLALSAGCTIPNSDYNNDSTTTLTLSSLTGCTAGDTSITPTVTYTAVANCTTAMSICDAAGANQMANGANTTATDGAAPQFKTFTYQDADADGKIDTFLITYTESTNAASVLQAAELTLTVGDFTSAAFGSATTDVADGGTTDSITLGTESTVVDTADGSGTIAVTSTSAVNNSFSLTDGTNNNTTEKAETQVTFADGAAPQFKTFTYQDNDGDGKIDQFLITYSESTAAGSVLQAAELTLTVGDFTAGAFGSATDDVADGGTTDTIALGTESTAVDTAEGSGNIAVTSTSAVNNSFSLTDGTNNNTTEKAEAQATFSDGAAPQIKSFTYQDADTDAKIDTLLITYSESTNAASVLQAAELSLTNVGNFTALAFGSATTDIADGGTTDTITLGTESTAEDTEENAGTIAISTTSAVNNSMSLTDGTTANTTEEAEAQATFIDGAGAVLISSTPAASATGIGRTTDIVLTFSEEIDITADTVALSPNVTHTETWSVSNSVLTLDGAWGAGANTVTFTAVPDTAASANSFAGAQSGDSTVASPLTFQALAASSSATSSTSSEEDEEYDVEVTSPNGGESYEAGESVEITWSSSGQAAMSAVNINLMYSEDGSTVQETIVSGTSNDGSYTWLVPDIASDEVKIQIAGTDLADSLAVDESDDYFSVGVAAEEGDDADEEEEEESGEEVTVPSSGETGTSPVTGEEEEISEVSAGMYIRSSYFDTVYYIEDAGDGTLVRRPFMDAQTFMTYADDWDDVETVTDATLPTMELGSVMLPNDGVVLVKIVSVAKVYAIEDGALRWITSEDVAIEMYGDDWADYVIDIPDTLFPRFDEGDDIDVAEDADTSVMKTREAVNS